MSIEKLLLDYQRKGVELALNGDKLKFKAPKDTLTDEDKEILKESKSDIIKYLQTHTESALIQDTEGRFEEFPLTDIQSSYLIGQGEMYKFGGTNCKIYSEFEFDKLLPEKAQKAWEKVVDNNEMLHAVIEKSGVQRILKEYKVPEIVFHDFDSLSKEEADKEIENIRERMTMKQYKPGEWPQFDFELSKINGKNRIHFSLDMLVSDFVSINLIFDEFEAFYNDREVKSLTDLSFRDIVIYRENQKNTVSGKEKYQVDKEYWLEKIENMPGAPEFPILENAKEEGVLFKQLNFFIDADRYKRICDNARSEKVTQSNLILTAYAEVLKSISKNKAFCIDVTMSDRPEIHPDIKKVVGDFTVASILEIQDKEYDSFLDEVKSVQERLWDDLSHNYFSSTEVLRELGKKHKSDIAVPAVYTSTLGAFTDEKETAANLVYTISQTPQVLIDCQILEVEGMLRVNWDVRKGVFPEGLIEDAFEAFKQKVVELSDSETLRAPIKSSLTVSLKEKRKEVNNTYQDIKAGYLYDGFIKNLNENPESSALISGGKIYSYKELAGYVEALRKNLKSAGIKKGDIVAIALPKGVWQIAATLSILTLGATYLPLDVHQPSQRAEKIIKSAGVAACVLKDTDYIADGLTAKIDVSDINPEESVSKIDVDAPEISSAAYIIFTSGSTGDPKGVVISHEAASNTILDINKRYGVNSKDRLFNLANLGFDLSVYDIFGAFYAGAALVQADDDKTRDPQHWLSLIRQHNVSIWNSVPAQMKMLTMFMQGEEIKTQESLRLVLMSGDWIPTDLPADIVKSFPNAVPISLGGATEAAIWSIYYPIDIQKIYEKSIPYGKPLANQRFYILDKKLKEVPNWVTGDIYIAGKGLALEYLGDKKLTDEKFIYVEELGERLYKTGDIGRYMADGNIEFQGREDFQVKIRGHRVELGEIEAAVSDVANLKDMKVIAVKHNDVASICMFGVLNDGQNEPDKEFMDEKLKERIPAYMVPSYYIYLPSIPLTKNGKVDNKALSVKAVEMIEANKSKSTSENSELTEKEQNIYTAWCEVFNTKDIGIDDDFFEYGGDSILIVKLITDMESKFGYKISLADVYAGPTIRQMAAMI